MPKTAKTVKMGVHNIAIKNLSVLGPRKKKKSFFPGSLGVQGKSSICPGCTLSVVGQGEHF